MATFSCRVQYLDDRDPFTTTSFPEPTRPPTFSFLDNVPLINQITGIHRLLQAPQRVEDCALQICHYQSGSQGEFGSYLELESTIDEQAEELECFADQRKNTLILRTQLSVRVHAIIEKLSNSNGRELRRALFCLKQIFQDDKDLIHEFVNNDGLNCLISVGTVADPNYQNYILRALGQVMLYVDGMEGVIHHNATIQWLYTLLASKTRLVVKTTLKLLLVFVEYTESNTIQLIMAINYVDCRRGLHPWTNIMSLLSEKDGADTELLIYTMTLINKVISAIPDQDTFYDVTDCLEEQNIDAISKWHLSKQGADLDLLTQFQLYESALKHEDGEDSSAITQVENLRQVPRKKSEGQMRKSKRHEGGQDHSPSQASISDMPQKPVRRKRLEQRQSFPVTQSTELSGPGANRHHVPTSEKQLETDQQKVETSPQNSRTHRRDRQRMFNDKKHELPSLMDRQGQGELPVLESEQKASFVSLSISSPTPYNQADTSSVVNAHTGTSPDFLPVFSPTLDRAPTNHTHPSRSGELTSYSENTFKSRHSDTLDGPYPSVSTYSSHSYGSKQIYQTGKLPGSESPQGMTPGSHQQVGSKPTTPTSPDSAQAMFNRPRGSLNLPVLQFDSHIPVENSTPRTNDKSNVGTSQQHYQPHHPHFYNHYHHNDQVNNRLAHHSNIPDNDHSFVSDDNNYSNQEPRKHSNRETEFENRPQAEMDSCWLESRIINDNQSNSTVASSVKRDGLYKQDSQNEDLKPAWLQKTTGNDILITGSQVKNMLNRLKNEDIEAAKEALRPVGDISGIISNAKDNIARQNAPRQPPSVLIGPVTEPEKRGESDFQWDKIQRGLRRQLKIKDMDFTDLTNEDDMDIFSSSMFFSGSDVHASRGIPPPPPPMIGSPPSAGNLPPPPPPPISLSSSLLGGSSPLSRSSLPPPLGANIVKNKKTVRLHWQALPADNPHPATKGDMIWKHLLPVRLDTAKLEHLFESKTSELKIKDVKQDAGGKKEITVLDPKRSNAINIGLTVLPPPRSIKAAILKMDNSIINKEGIEKILTTMIPTDEEKTKIMEAQMANPDIPLGPAEQFLLTLSSIFELEARLNLWLFKLDYELSEQELAEPLMDLKKGIEELRRNRTFRCILSGVLTIGNFLNGNAVHAFNIEFLQRLPEIKDTVRKHSLIHHLCTLLMEQFPDTTDLYSDIGHITRCSRVDWDELANKMNKMENDCKASWDYLQAIVKHDGSISDVKGKMSSFLTDAAERIMILQIIYKRILNRYNKLLLFLGFHANDVREMKVNHFCKVISEFALEYRTTRDKVIQMQQKKANQRERKKTRGKMIVDMENFRKKDGVKDDALDALLRNGYATADETGLPGQRSRRRLETKSLGARASPSPDIDTYDTGEDEILEACVRTATASNSRPLRERKRARTQRKSLRRTLKGGLATEEVQVIEAYNDHV